MILIFGIIFLFLSVSIIQVAANVNTEIQDKQPTEELVWNCAVGVMYNFNLPNGTRIDYLFKIKTEDRLSLFAVKISGNWGGTSYVTPILKAPYNFTMNEYYEVTMLYANLVIFPENFNGRPYFIDDPFGWTKLFGSGYGIKVYH
jgi:hypothetical protein